MKTKFLFPTVLAFATQMVVNGQTHINQIPNNTTVSSVGTHQTTKTKSNKTTYFKELVKQANYCDSVATRLKAEAKKRNSAEREMMMEEVLNLREQSLIKQIEASELSYQIDYEKFYQNSNSILLAKNNMKEDWYTVNKTGKFRTKEARIKQENAATQNKNYSVTYKGSTSPQILESDNFQTKSNSTFIADLLQESFYCDSVADQLFFESTKRASAEKEMMQESVTDLRNLSQQKQIEASSFSGKVAYVNFYQNSIYIDLLLDKIKENKTIVAETEKLNEKAEKFMVTAKNMRAEANSFESNGAKLGGMMNAEEQEYFALDKQNEAIYILKQTNQNMTGSSTTMVYNK